MKVVVITGSRYLTDAGAVCDVLNACDMSEGDLVLVGDCPTGADAFARMWATSSRFIPRPNKRVFEAAWQRYGVHAGPERNQRMVDCAMGLKSIGHEVSAHAFPLAESRGTRDCIRKLSSAGIPVTVHERNGRG